MKPQNPAKRGCSACSMYSDFKIAAACPKHQQSNKSGLYAHPSDSDWEYKQAVHPPVPAIYGEEKPREEL